jgi:DNA end-binding protein Ku
MKMVDPRGRPLGREYYSEEHQKGLASEDLVRGYETDDGTMIVVTDEELDAIAPDMSRDIDLRRFVPKDDIPPFHFERPYFLAPAGNSTKAYHLLAQTMHETGRVGVGTFVMRGHQYLVAILSDGRLLRAETLRFAAELRSPETLELPRRRKPPRAKVQRFSKAIGALMRDDLDMDELADRYADRIRELVDAKLAKKKDVVDLSRYAAELEDAEEQEADGDVVDLMRLLRRRLGKGAKVEAPGPAPRGRAQGRGASGDRAPDRRAARKGASGGRADLAGLSKDELYRRARERDVPGRSTMGKRELLAALRAAEAKAA